MIRRHEKAVTFGLTAAFMFGFAAVAGLGAMAADRDEAIVIGFVSLSAFIFACGFVNLAVTT